MDRSPRFRVYPLRLFALLRLAFASAADLKPLALPQRVTRRLIMQKARRHTSYRIVLRLIVGMRFQVLFHSPLGVLFTFPSRYWFTIGH